MSSLKLKRMPTHPGIIIKEDFMVPLNLTQVELAKALKTTFRTINEIINGKRSVSTEMALKLGKYFNTSAEIWMGLQTDYDLYKIMQKSKRVIDGIKPVRQKAA